MAAGARAAAIRANMTTWTTRETGMASPEQVAAATEALDAVREEWMSWSGVISVEVARRWIEGVPTDEVGIRVTLEKLLSPENVPPGELFPEALSGVPVDVLEGTPPVLER